MTNKEYILCAAIWYHDLPRDVKQRGMQPVNTDQGLVVCGWRHGNVIVTTKELSQLRTVKNGDNSVGKTTQGFLTNKNRFVDRIEAMEIAIEAGQGGCDGEMKIGEPLFSEDLY